MNCCDDGKAWLKKNRSKGLRWIIRAVYNRKDKHEDWMRNYPANLNVSSPAEGYAEGCPEGKRNSNVVKAAYEIGETWYTRYGRGEKAILAILDKYEIDDVFAD